MEVKGFKVFNKDWTCRNKQYTCPGEFEEDVKLEVCGAGMHFCKQAKDCFNYYSFDPENKVAEVIAVGDVKEDGDKCCTDKLIIVREIPWLELLTLVNLGKGCTGFCNTGNRNTGDWNTGDWNTGNRNTGDWNTGDWNTGDCNTGDWNTGDCNTGDWNTGDCNTGDWNTGDCNTGNCNTGDWNTGDCNTGDWNTGDWNTGDCNTGDWNTGDCNTGNCNTGDWNTGDCNTGNRNTGNRNTGDWNTGDCNTGNRNTGNRNTGDWNTGDWNTGDWNTGDWNTGDCNTGDWNTGDCNTGDCNQSDFCTGDFNIVDNESGCFCTEPHTIRIFDQESNITFEQWRNSSAYRLLCRIDFRPNEWVCSSDMTEDEKKAHPEHETTGGYLKVNDTDKAFLVWWDNLSSAEKETIKKIPNFNPEKFLLITGIKI